VRHGVDEGFIRPRHARLFTEVGDVAGILSVLSDPQGVDVADSFT
jgi:hypothetical protein